MNIADPRNKPAGEVVTDGLPNGWSLHVRPGLLGIGVRADGCYDLHRATQEGRDEAAALGVDLGDDYDPVITRSWAITKDRAVRFARAVVAETAAMPMGEWL